MKKLFLFICTLLSAAIAVGQPAVGKIDSLRREIAVNKDSSGYDKLFQLVSEQSGKLSPDQDLHEAMKTIKSARSLKDSIALIYAYRNLGNAYVRAKRTGEALAAFQRGYDLALINERGREQGLIALRLGMFYYNEQFFTEALEKLSQAGEVFESLNDLQNQFKVSYAIALINYRTKNYEATTNEANRAASYFKKISYPLRSDSFDVMSAYNTIGLAAFQMKQFDKGLTAFDQSEAIARGLQNEFWIGLINGNRAKIYRAQGFISIAIENLKKDFAISMKFNERASAASSATTLADIYIDGKNFKLAGKYLDTAAFILQNVKSIQTKLNSARTRARYYESIGDLTKAMKAQKEVMAFKDSVIANNERINLGRFRARYELEKKQTEITALQHANELQREKIDNQRVIIWSTGIILGLVVLLVLVIVRDSYRMKAQYSVISTQRKEIENKNEELEVQSNTLQQQNEIIGSINLQLEEKVKLRTEELDNANKELDRFLYHASHDIRRPIATLLGLEQVFQLSGRETWQMLFEKVSDTAHSMDSMLYKLHMAYELNRPTGERGDVNLHEVIDETSRVFDPEILRRNIDYVHVIGSVINFSSNTELLKVIFRNLIENSISFRRPHLDERPYVRIRSYIKEAMIVVEIEDNGIGIDPKYTERIFDLYFRGTQQSKGNGVGLYLAKKAVVMLGGDILVTSEWGTGSTFSVHLPLNQ